MSLRRLTRTSLTLAVIAAINSSPALVHANSNDPIGSQFQVNTESVGNKRLPGVASDADGDFVVVWQRPTEFAGIQPQGTFNDIVAQRFDSGGTP